MSRTSARLPPRPLLPLLARRVRRQLPHPRQEITPLHVRLQHLGDPQTFWGLIVFDDATQRTLGRAQGAVEHVNERDGLTGLAVAVADVQAAGF